MTIWYAGAYAPAYKSSTHNNKYQVLHKHSCFSWWSAHSRLKYVQIDKYTKNKLCTELVLFTKPNIFEAPSRKWYNITTTITIPNVHEITAALTIPVVHIPHVREITAALTIPIVHIPQYFSSIFASHCTLWWISVEMLRLAPQSLSRHIHPSTFITTCWKLCRSFSGDKRFPTHPSQVNRASLTWQPRNTEHIREKS